MRRKVSCGSRQRHPILTMIIVVLVTLSIPFSWNALAADGQFEPPYTDHGRDDNGDGYYDYLVFNATVNVTEAGTFNLYGGLYDSTTELITEDVFQQVLSVGVHILPFEFDGIDIYNSKEDGPYSTYLYLYDQMWQNLSWDYALTNNYSYEEFQHNPVEFNPPHYDYGLDTNANSLYDFLVAEVNITVNTNGTYRIEGDLYDSTGSTWIWSDSNESSFVIGNYTVELRFLGCRIRVKEKDGPYELELELKKGDSQVLDEDVHTTRSYSYTDFEGFAAYFTGPSSDEGIDLNGNSLYEYLKVTVGVRVNDSGYYEIEGDLSDDSVIPVYITSTTNSTYLNQGNTTVDLYFLGYKIYEVGINSKYIAELELRDANNVLLSRWMHTTPRYNYDDFEPYPPASLDPPHSDYGLDINSNSLYDYLVVDLSVDVDAPLGYRFNSSLYDSTHSTFITGTENVTNLSAGARTVPLYFNGWDIYNSTINGSFNVTIRVYDQYDHFLGRGYHNTTNYTYDEFEHEVIDTVLPQIQNVLASPSPQEINGYVNITANITDDQGVAIGLVNVTDPDGQTVGNYTLSFDSDTEKYYHEQPYTKLGTYSFKIWAMDIGYNWNSSSGSFSMVDTTPPSISNVSASPDPQEIYAGVNITSTVVDNHNLTMVKVNISDPDGLLVGNYTMLYDSGSGKHYYLDSYSKLGNYTFTIWAKDSSDNWNSSTGSFTIHDTTPPSITNATASPNPQEIYGNVNITASVSDNYNLTLVKVDIVDPDGGSVGNFTMLYDPGSGKFCYEQSYSKLGNYTFTIWAKDSSNNWNSSSGSFSIVDSAPPSISNVTATPNPQEVYEKVNITAEVSDNENVSTVMVLVVDPDGLTVGNYSMVLDSDSGKYYFENPYSKVGNFTYTIWAKDNSGNWNSSSESFTMVDTTKPTITNVNANPNPQEVYEDVNISATVADNYNLSEVKVVIVDPDGQLVGNFSMSFDSGSGKHYYQDSYSKLGNYSFTIWAKDSSGNWNSSIGGFTIHDTTPPVISNLDASPNPQEVFGNVNITASVTDNYNLTTVKVVVLDPDGGLVGNYTMVYDSGTGKYCYNQSYSKLGNYSYTVWAKDSFNNWNYSSSTFTMQDTTPPGILNVNATPNPQEVHGNVNITASVSDNWMVNLVKAVVTDPDGIQVGNFTMGYDSGSGKYCYEQTYSKLGNYSFTVWARDSSGNWNWSSGSFTMQDTTPPVISEVDATPDPQEVHGSVNITASVSDNSNVSEVKVVIWDPDGLLVGNFSMTFDSDKGKYYYESTYSKLGNYSFTVWAKDTSDNWVSASDYFRIHDTTPPTFSNVSASPNPQEVFGSVNITVEVGDNVNVSEVYVIVTDPDGIDLGNFSMTYDPGTGKYYHEDSYSKLGVFSFTIWANDTSDNWNSTSGSFTMHDTTPPTISDVSASPNPQEVFGSVNITATIEDNFNLSYAVVAVFDPDGLLVGNFSMQFDSGTGKHFYEDTYSKLGDYSFTVWAVDSSSNWNSSSGSFTLYDTTPPEIQNAEASPNPQEVFGDVNITVTVTDNIQLSEVKAVVTDPDGLPVGNFSMVYDSGSSKYYFETSYSKLGLYSFEIWAKDTSDNWNWSSGNFNMHDTTPPEISNVSETPDPQEVYGNVNITASVSDNFNLTTVKVEIWDPHGVFVGNLTMIYDPGSGYFYYESSYPEIGDYSYTIWAKDSSDNWNSTSGSFTMFDVTFPMIQDVIADPNPQETGGSVNVSAVVTDDVGVFGVWIEIYDPLNALIGNFTMDYDSLNGRFYHESSYSPLGTYSFTIVANDTSNSWNSTSRTFVIQDSTLPTISDVTAAPDPQEVHGSVNITALVGDNYELVEVRVVITDPDGLSVGNFSMLLDPVGGAYYYESTYSKVGLYSFVVLAKDSSDNWNNHPSTFLMVDTTDPIIVAVTASPDPQEVHGNVNISVNATDNYLIEDVKVEITDPDGQLIGNLSMIYDAYSGEYYFEDSYSKIGTYTFVIWVRDSSGNWNSQTSSFVILDTTLPEISDLFALPSPLEVPGNVNISVHVSDNYQLNVITVEVLDPDGLVLGNFSMLFDPVSGRYFFEGTYLDPGNHTVTVWAEDVSGNWNYLSCYFIMVDTTNPSIWTVNPSPNPQEVYGTVNITATITDNHEILKASVIVSDPDGMFMGNFTMFFDATNGFYYYESTYSMIGNFKITVFAIDKSGNWITRLSSFDMIDTAIPEISSVSAIPDPQEVFGDVTTSARVDDNYQLNDIKVVILDPDGLVVGNFSMSYDIGNDLYYHITTCQKIGTYTFTIWAADTSWNWNSSSGSFVVQDTTPPMIGNVVSTPDPQEVHGSVEITAMVSDNYELSDVSVLIHDPDGTPIGNFSMLYDGASGLYHYESTYSKIGTHTFTIWATDTSGNWNQLDSSFVVEDTTSPTISNVDASPDPQQVFGWVEISAEVTDNYQLSNVHVEVFDPASLLLGNFSMIYDSISDRYLFGITCDVVGVYDFLIAASDSEDNWQLHPGQFTIVDDSPPVVTNTTASPQQQLPFGDVNISTSAYDNYLLSEVLIDIRDPNSNSIGNFTMGYDVLSDKFFWEDAYGIIGEHQFCIWARDSSGNWGSFCGQFTIADDIPPNITNAVASPDPQEVFGIVNISTVVTDNYLVEEVTVLIKDPTGMTIGNHSMQFGAGSGTYFHEVTCSSLGTYSFEIWAKDGGDNWASFAGWFDVQDTTSPDADAGADQEIMNGDTITFDGSGSTDNFAIESYEWTFNDGIEDVVLHGVSPQHTFQEAGIYTITLTVTDSSGNADQDTVIVEVIGEKIPHAPAGLTVIEVGDDFIHLTWTAPTENTDGSELTNLKGYHIYRSGQSGGPYVKIGTLIILSESYVDRNLYSGFVGHYVVTGYTFDGVESAHSNEAIGIIPEKGSVSGRIVDDKGLPVLGAHIELKKDGSPVAVSESDEKGNFTIEEIDDGVYEIVISKTGFVTFSEDIVIINGEQVVIDDLTIETVPETGSQDMPLFEVIIVVTVVIVLIAIALLAVKRRSKKKESE